MRSVELDPRLAADSHYLAELKSGHVLLHRNATLPWFILVPHTDLRRLHEVASPLRQQITAEMDALADYVMRAFDSEHVNVASIGNIVEQLHIHVIGRRQDDPLWPGVVWGRIEPGPQYTESQVATIAATIKDIMSHV